MGSFKVYNSKGGFTQYLYRQVGESVSADGVTAKITTRIDDDAFHSSLPLYSNTSTAYAKCSDKGNHEIEQLRIYSDRKAAIDFDWGHQHGACAKGVVHVHIVPSNGSLRGNPQKVRYMNNEEIAKYGALIKKLNPNVKLRAPKIA